ncbi:MAG TPA: hypothetical protein PK264_16270 [Hyphomicrobiaceae bacterium]|nr:hypothetical protein [Hyphomicrobiaceae bacterium]
MLPIQETLDDRGGCLVGQPAVMPEMREFYRPQALDPASSEEAFEDAAAHATIGAADRNIEMVGGPALRSTTNTAERQGAAELAQQPEGTADRCEREANLSTRREIESSQTGAGKPRDPQFASNFRDTCPPIPPERDQPDRRNSEQDEDRLHRSALFSAWLSHPRPYR